MLNICLSYVYSPGWCRFQFLAPSGHHNLLYIMSYLASSFVCDFAQRSINGDSARCLMFLVHAHLVTLCSHFIFVNCFEITATFHFSSFWIQNLKMPDGNGLPCCWNCWETFHQPAYCNNNDDAVTQVWTVFTLRLASHFRNSVCSFFFQTECGGCDRGTNDEVC